jgi:hypothetical protein
MESYPIIQSLSITSKIVSLYVLTTFKNFPVETLSDMWRTKTRVLKAIYRRMRRWQ